MSTDHNPITQPSLTYFVELPPESVPPEERSRRLYDLFAQNISDEHYEKIPFGSWLRAHDSGVSIAMSHLDSRTADTVDMLNVCGVPVTGWVVLPDSQGYWSNRSNMTQTSARAWEVLDWARNRNVRLAAIGLDIEKPLDYLSALGRGDIPALIRAVRSYRTAVKEQARRADPVEQMQGLIEGIRDEGYTTEVYEFPKPAIVKRLLGGMAVANADRTIEMAYLSAVPRFLRLGGQSLRLLLSRGAIPGLGLVTGVPGETPGRDLTGKLPNHLDEAELSKQMTIAMRRLPDARELYIFALNHLSVARLSSRALASAIKS